MVKEKSSKEAHAYTPGLKGKRATTIAKRRHLPIYGEVLSKVGDVVTCNTIVARAEIRGEPEIVKVAIILAWKLRTYPDMLL